MLMKNRSPNPIQGRCLFFNARKGGESPCDSCGVVKRSDHSSQLNLKADFCSRPSSRSPKFNTGSGPVQFLGAASVLVATIGLMFLMPHFKLQFLTSSHMHSPWIMSSFISRNEGGPVQGARDEVEDTDDSDNDDLDIDEMETRRPVQGLDRPSFQQEVARLHVDYARNREDIARMHEEIARLRETYANMAEEINHFLETHPQIDEQTATYFK